MPSKTGLTDEQRHALVEWLQSDENDGGWYRHAARQAAWAFHDWLEKCGLVVVPDNDASIALGMAQEHVEKCQRKRVVSDDNA